MTDKEWRKFLKWLYKTHSITKDWTLDRTSIELWEEYERDNFVDVNRSI